MSKKYKGKTCVYCGASGKSETKDHVVARQFVLSRHRHNLPTVPACRACNNKKSALEKYCTTVLPFGGRHSDARETMISMVPKRLKADFKLSNSIRKNFGPVIVQSPTGSIQHVGVVLIEVETLKEWLKLVVTGLIWHHWKIVVAGETDVTVELVATDAEQELLSIFQKAACRRVPPTSVGEGSLVYEGAMAVDEQLCSTWRVGVYGGIEFSGCDSRIRGTVFYVFVTRAGRLAERIEQQ